LNLNNADRQAHIYRTALAWRRAVIIVIGF